MPANGSDLVGRLLAAGFAVEKISLADNPLPLILSHSMTSTLNCPVTPRFSDFCFTSSHLLPRWERGSNLAALCGNKDLGLLTASFCFLTAS